MIRILFVCLGNICRSPMSEYVFKDMIEKRDLNNKFIIESAATSNEETGNDMHYGTKKKLQEKGIKFDKHIARQMNSKDYDKYDLLIGMESKNVTNMKRIVKQDKEDKIFRLLDFSNNPRDIADPWYTGNFTITFDDIEEGCVGLLKYLEKYNFI